MTNKITTICAYTKYILYYMLTLYNNLVNIMIIGITSNLSDDDIYDIYDNEIETEADKETQIIEETNTDNTNSDELNFNTIKQLLKTQTLYILGLRPNKNDVIVLKRIYHILYYLFKNYDIYKEKEIIQLNNMISSMLYIPPWDTEEIIFTHLDNLCMFLSIHYSYDEKIEKVITEDITKISIYEEIDKILAL